MKQIFAVLFSLVLFGCASNSYDVNKVSQETSAYIKGYDYRDGVFNWLSIMVEGIDGETVSYFLKSEENYNVPVSPGSRDLALFAQYNNSLFDSCPCKGYFNMTVNFQENQNYIINANQSDKGIDFWVENTETGEIVSEVIETKKR